MGFPKGGRQNSDGNTKRRVFLVASIYISIYYAIMNTNNPSKLLEQLAKIQRMEPGKLCVMRQGTDGANGTTCWII